MCTEINFKTTQKESCMRYVKLFLIALVLSAFLAQFLPAYADDVLDTVEEAITLYKAGKYAEAAGNFEYAGQLARQKRSGELSDFLPQALNGWEAEEAETQAMGAAMFGGMTSSERTYRKGDSMVTVSIMADSPMIQSVIMLLQNPMLAAAQGELVKIAGRKAIINYDASDQSGQLQLVAANQYLIQVSGSEAAKEDILAYAGGVNYDGLEKK